MRTIRGLFVLLSAATLALGCSGPSGDEIKNYAKQCVSFYEKERASGKHVEYRTHWMKDGRLVISLAEKKYQGADSYSEGLCVVDFKDGTIQLPGLFNQGRWQR
jgi:hypothetical protein